MQVESEYMDVGETGCIKLILSKITNGNTQKEDYGF